MSIDSRSVFSADAAVHLATHTRLVFSGQSETAEIVAQSRKVMAASRLLMKAVDGLLSFAPNWEPISTAPRDQEIEVCVMDGGDAHVLVGACHLTDAGWLEPITRRFLEINPTHWRAWSAGAS